MLAFWTYKLLNDFLVVVPVMVPLYRSCGLSATEIFAVQAVFSVTQLGCEVPSGYLADVVGRRRTMVLGAALVTAGRGRYAVSDRFWQFALAELVLGLSTGMRSGTDSAWLFDTLKARDETGRYTALEGRAESLTRFGSALSALLGGVLAAYVLRLPFYVNVVTAALLLAVSLLLTEPPREARPHGHPMRNILAVVRSSLRTPRVLTPMLFSALAMGTGITAIWGYLMFVHDAEVPLSAYGALFAAFQLCAALGAQQAWRVERLLKGPGTLLLICAIGLMLLPFSLAASAWLLPVAFLHAFVWGCSTPLFLERVNRLTASEVRATTLSTGAMLGRVVYIAVSLGFGALVDRASLASAFLALALTYGVAAGVLTAVLVRQDRAAGAAPSLPAAG